MSAGCCIVDDLPPVVCSDLMRDGRLLEFWPRWRLPVLSCLLQPVNRGPSETMEPFVDFAGDMVPKLFPELPN